MNFNEILEFIHIKIYYLLAVCEQEIGRNFFIKLYYSDLYSYILRLSPNFQFILKTLSSPF